MIPTHHVPEDRLLAYAAGTASEAAALVVACHITLCPACRARVQALEEVGGALLASEEAAALPEDALARTLARLDEPAPVVAETQVPVPPFAGLPRPLLRLLGRAPGWRRILPGIQGIDVPVNGPRDTAVRLIRLRPGIAIPLHDHAGNESIVVFAGGLLEGDAAFHRGDVSVHEAGQHHRQKVAPGEPCVALLVNEGALLPLTWWGKLLARLLGR